MQWNDIYKLKRTHNYMYEKFTLISLISNSRVGRGNLCNKKWIGGYLEQWPLETECRGA